MSKLKTIKVIDERLASAIIQSKYSKKSESNRTLELKILNEIKVIQEYIDSQKGNIYISPIQRDKHYLEIYGHYVWAKIRVRQFQGNEITKLYDKPIIEYDCLCSKSDNITDKEKIARFICHSTLDFAISKIDTIDRLKIWILQKDNTFRLASCFLKKKEMLDEECKEGILKKDQAEVIYLDYKTFYNVYELINFKWAKIEKKFRKDKKFSFNSSLDFFLKLLQTHINQEYQLFLYSHMQHDSKENKNVYSLLEKIDKLPKNSLKKKNLEKQIQEINKSDISQNYWLKKLKSFCEREASKDRYIEKYIKTTNKYIKNRLKIINQKNFKTFHTYTMIDGLMYSNKCYKSKSGQIRKARSCNKFK